MDIIGFSRLKKVVVFGGSGFLGSYIVEELISKNYDVVVFDLIKNDLFSNKNIKFIEGSILDESLVNETTKDADIVYNLVAIMDLQECIDDPIKAIKLNILGNANILQSCINNKVKRFIFASSVYSYNSIGGIYASTKRASEDIIKNYSKYTNIQYTILQYGTLYGLGSQKNNSIFNYVRSAVEEGIIKYVGTGNEVREFIHILDAAKLSVEILSEEYINKTLILTGHHPTKISDLFMMIQEILSKEIIIEYETNVEIAKKHAHYKITPYTNMKEMPLKLTNDKYVDLGLGILQIIQSI